MREKELTSLAMKITKAKGDAKGRARKKGRRKKKENLIKDLFHRGIAKP